MGQQDVYEFLKKNKRKWFSGRDIANGLKASIGSTVTSLKRLRESGQIYFRTIDRKIAPTGRKKIYVYKYM